MTDPLNILLPERTLTLAGESVTVHEYTLAEQLRYRKPLAVLATAFTGLLQTLPEGDIAPSIDALFDVLADHTDDVLTCVAVACGRDMDFISGLVGKDTEDVMLVWWGVNADFFTRCALRPLLESLVRQAHPLTGGRSSRASSSTDMTPGR